MAIEYLGSKSRLLDFVVGPIAELPGIRTVADIFCGTAAVSQALGQQGLRVVANDHMRLCATLAEAALLSDGPPCFVGLASEVARSRAEPAYDAVLRALNALAPEDGFLFRTYSPASAATGTTRMYLTERNAGRADAIRAQIERWTPALTRAERAILLRDLVQAVSAVSNTAGTYGCYLKTWKQRALRPLTMRAEPGTPPLPPPAAARGPAGSRAHEVRCEDAEAVAGDLRQVDAAYLDPPYTKRQYAAYYHLLETLVSGDTPAVTGSTGLPGWRDRQSDFCHKRRARGALERIVGRLDVAHIFLSYSEDGHIAHEEILDVLGARGVARTWELPSQRYRSSALAHSASVVRERLYHVAVA